MHVAVVSEVVLVAGLREVFNLVTFSFHVSHAATLLLGGPAPDSGLVVVYRPLQTLNSVRTGFAQALCYLYRSLAA